MRGRLGRSSLHLVGGVTPLSNCAAAPDHTTRQKALLCKVLFWGTWHRRGPRREAGKRSGKNLVFPRGPAAASASDMIVISALRRNNTPPMAQEGPSGFRRWEVRCPDSHIFFACVRCFCPGKERNGSSVTLVRWPDGHTALPRPIIQPGKKALLCKGVFLGHLAPVETPPGGWKKVGEKLSFSPRASGGVSFRYDRYFGLVPK